MVRLRICRRFFLPPSSARRTVQVRCHEGSPATHFDAGNLPCLAFSRSHFPRLNPATPNPRLSQSEHAIVRSKSPYLLAGHRKKAGSSEPNLIRMAMSESNAIIAKREAIQILWAELGRTKHKTPEYETLLKKIRVLSAEYQLLVNASNNKEKQIKTGSATGAES